MGCSMTAMNSMQQTTGEDFVDEFRRRRDYDPSKYLPLLEGWKLDDSDVQTRFLADYRKTVEGKGYTLLN